MTQREQPKPLLPGFRHFDIPIQVGPGVHPVTGGTLYIIPIYVNESEQPFVLRFFDRENGKLKRLIAMANEMDDFRANQSCEERVAAGEKPVDLLISAVYDEKTQDGLVVNMRANDGCVTLVAEGTSNGSSRVFAHTTRQPKTIAQASTDEEWPIQVIEQDGPTWYLLGLFRDMEEVDDCYQDVIVL